MTSSSEKRGRRQRMAAHGERLGHATRAGGAHHNLPAKQYVCRRTRRRRSVGASRRDTKTSLPSSMHSPPLISPPPRTLLAKAASTTSPRRASNAQRPATNRGASSSAIPDLHTAPASTAGITSAPHVQQRAPKPGPTRRAGMQPRSSTSTAAPVDLGRRPQQTRRPYARPRVPRGAHHVCFHPARNPHPRVRELHSPFTYTTRIPAHAAPPPPRRIHLRPRAPSHLRAHAQRQRPPRSTPMSRRRTRGVRSSLLVPCALPLPLYTPPRRTHEERGLCALLLALRCTSKPTRPTGVHKSAPALHVRRKWIFVRQAFPSAMAIARKTPARAESGRGDCSVWGAKEGGDWRGPESGWEGREGGGGWGGGERGRANREGGRFREGRDREGSGEAGESEGYIREGVSRMGTSALINARKEGEKDGGDGDYGAGGKIGMRGQGAVDAEMGIRAGRCGEAWGVRRRRKGTHPGWVGKARRESEQRTPAPVSRGISMVIEDLWMDEGGHDLDVRRGGREKTLNDSCGA
ncbi:hypothetical protein DFH09DRAFT_1076700 [Mycena vulgaris]|nr:hypothetical protein DFH09DRAFT_1076700 [Mycena vulgaris]